MWLEDKKKEMQERRLIQALYRDLVGMAKQNELNKKVSLYVKEICSFNILKIANCVRMRETFNFCLLLNKTAT